MGQLKRFLAVSAVLIIVAMFPTSVKADELLNIEATAYCVTGTTATGTQTTEDRTSAGHPSWYGKTAIVWEDKGNGIEAENLIGIYTVEDTGKKGGKVRNGECIDIYMKDYSECRQFGRKKVIVYLY